MNKTQEEGILNWDEFKKVEMRVGTVLSAVVFKEVKKPAYQLVIDFGSYGTKKTSAQITQLYQPEDLVGKQVVAVVNFPPKQIANIMSECLLLGALGEGEDVTIISPNLNVKNGTRIA